MKDTRLEGQNLDVKSVGGKLEKKKFLLKDCTLPLFETTNVIVVFPTIVKVRTSATGQSGHNYCVSAGN